MSVILKHTLMSMVDGREDIDELLQPTEFTTLEELLAVPFVSVWKEADGFGRYSLSDHCLMAEFPSAGTWWVIGRIVGEIPEGLPKWVHP